MKKSVFTILGIASVFMGCGDQNTTNVYEQNVVISLEKGAKLPQCSEENDGIMTFVPDSATVYFCSAGEWISLNGKDGENGEKGDKGDKGSDGANGLNGVNCDAVAADGGFNIVCGGEVKGFVKNGDDGNDGKDGQSCTAKDTVSESGLAGMNIDCAGKRAGTLWNGKDGIDGEDGESCDAGAVDGGYIITCHGIFKGFIKNGVSCQIKSSTESSVTIACGDDAVTLQLPVAQTIPYTTECPAGKTCTYAPTEQLNPAKTYGEFLDIRDYQMYKTIEICDEDNQNCQTWMAQNLNYDYNEATARSYCYNNKSSNCDTYGRLYSWSAAMASAAVNSSEGMDCDDLKSCNSSGSIRGVCPQGWHLPSGEDLIRLIENMGYHFNFMSTRFFGTDLYGFSALPAGLGFNGGSFDKLLLEAIFWSSEEYDLEHAYSLCIDGERVGACIAHKVSGYSVRCLQDSN